jgi:hypothetical protein
MKSRTKLLLIIFVVIAVLGTVEVFTGPTLVHQLINMRHARQHLPIVRQKLDAIPEFRQLRLFVYTGSGGALLVGGYLHTEAEASQVREIVASTKPPVGIVYELDVITNEADRLIIWPNKSLQPTATTPSVSTNK